MTLMKRSKKIKIGIIGLGYVGLPLFISFSKKFKTKGFDIDKEKISDLRKSKDKTLQIKKNELLNLKKNITHNINELIDCNVFVVSVPTPVNKKKQPDLKPLKKACILISKIIKHKDLVIFESTSFPGTTENICAKIIENYSKIKYVVNNENEKKLIKYGEKYFYCGYSPERVNPGDNTHQLEKIVKIVSACTKESFNLVNYLYRSIIKAGTYKAQSIQIAEAAKIIENTQRDINIALFNELSIIFQRLKLNSKFVFDAASTKWNFHRYEPGLVGGHCISTDPYYLTYISKKKNYKPKIILAGRKLNDNMANWVFKNISHVLKEPKKTKKALILGLTFKENCPDIRNSQMIELCNMIGKKNTKIYAYDPYIKSTENTFKKLKKFKLLNKLQNFKFKFDLIVIGVKHKEFKKIKINDLLKVKKKNGAFVDLKNLFPGKYSDFSL